jgi:uncharacterized protein YdeI (YjbR/CyaY-like superfamily)
MKEQITFLDRKAFRRWLLESIYRLEGIWLVFGKNGRLETLKPEEALEEALCFGWIDGQFESIDEAKYLKYFSPRRKGSRWSEKNKKLVEKLIDNGSMIEWGLKAIERAKQDGTWEASTNPSITQEQIDVFAGAIHMNDKALENFKKMPMSVKKQFVGLFFDAKKEDTRKRRLEKLTGLLEQNRKPM